MEINTKVINVHTDISESDEKVSEDMPSVEGQRKECTVYNSFSITDNPGFTEESKTEDVMETSVDSNSENKSDQKWYLAHFSRITVSDLKEKLENSNLEFFLPVIPVADQRRKNKHTVVERSSMFNMLFIRGKLNKVANFIYSQPRVCFMFNRKREYVTPLYRMADTVAIKQKMESEVHKGKKQNVADDNHFDMLCDESTFKDVVVIPDNQMQMFKKAIIYCDKESMPYVRPSDIDFEKGDRVRIIGGKLHGVEGYLENQQGKDGGHIIVKLCESCAVRTAAVEPEYIQIIEFAKTGKHIYKKFDSFMTRGERCMQKLIDRQEQDDKDFDYLFNFVRRFENLETQTKNMKAKLYLYIFIACVCMNDTERSNSYEKKLLEHIPKLNSEIMQATCWLNLFKCTRRERYREKLKQMINRWGKIEPEKQGDKKKLEIREEFKEYNVRF